MSKKHKKHKKKKGFVRPKVCRFCADKEIDIDYKDAKTLRIFLTERCKIIPRRISGNCARHQRRQRCDGGLLDPFGWNDHAQHE